VVKPYSFIEYPTLIKDIYSMNEYTDHNEDEIKLNGNHKRECKLCDTLYFPSIRNVNEMTFLCEVCEHGRDDTYRDLDIYVKHQAYRREQLNKAVTQPFFMTKFMLWLDEALKKPDVLEMQSLMFIRRSRMANRMKRIIDSRPTVFKIFKI